MESFFSLGCTGASGISRLSAGLFWKVKRLEEPLRRHLGASAGMMLGDNSSQDKIT